MRLLQEWRRFVDVFVEVRDARAPLLSHNPDIRSIYGDKRRVIVLNKADLADASITERWCRHLSTGDNNALWADSQRPDDGRLVAEIGQKKGSGRGTRIIRAAVIGVSNVGKSTIVNRLTGRKSAKVEARPGVTRQLKWVKVSESLEVLDSPGLVPPKISEGTDWFLTAALGIVPPDPSEMTEVACSLVERCGTGWAASAYSLEDYPMDGYGFLEALARKLSMKLKGDLPDIPRVSARIVNDFSKSKLPRVSMEIPPC